MAVAILLFWPWETPSPELQMCKDALEQWQSYDSYHIMQTAHHYGDTLGSIGQSEHLGIGDNRIYIHYDLYAETPGLYAMMQKNGQYYEFRSDSITAGKIFPWEETDAYLEIPTPWLIYFTWEDDKVLFKEAQYYPSGAVKQVTVTVVEQDPENRFYSKSPYNVIFAFSESGYVTTITQYLVNILEHNTASFSVVTFAMLNANAQSIEDAFVVPVISPR